MVMVGDRGMLTNARIEEQLWLLDWVTSLFAHQDLAEITSPDFPDERLMACYNPLLAQAPGSAAQGAPEGH